MKLRFNLRNVLILAFIATYVYILFQLFAKNLAVDPDYSFHAHSIWAAYNGFLGSDPFLSGGTHLTLAYGGPITLLGAAIYPVFGKFTAAILLGAGVPSLWYSARKVYRHFSSSRIAEIAALGAIFNPFTMYYSTCLLPFIWGVIFALGSIHFYLEKRTYLAVSLGLVAVITHPLAMFLFLALLLMGQNFRQWLKIFSVPLAVVATQFTLLWRIPIAAETISLYPLTVVVPNIAILASALVVAFYLKKETRTLSRLALIFLISWCIGGVFGLWIPVPYLNRIGFLIFLMMMPLLTKSVVTAKATISPHMKYALTAPILALIIAVGVYAGPVTVPNDSPSAYQEIPNDIVTTLQDGYVHYASDGSALYELPKLGVKFSNCGRNSYAQIPENAEAYAQRIEMENASFIIIYEGYSDSERIETEENLIRELGYPIIYSQDNVKIYKTHLAP